MKITTTKVIVGALAVLGGFWALKEIREKQLFSAPPGWDAVVSREGRIAFCRQPPRGYEQFCAMYLRTNL